MRPKLSIPLFVHVARAAGAAALLLMAGCIPLPHEEVTVPKLDGVVHRNGKPVAGARIYVGGGQGYCKAAGAPLAITDAQGAFHIAQQNEMIYMLVMDPASSLQVCLFDGGGYYLGWLENRMGGMRATLRLDCNLQDPMRSWRLGGYGEYAPGVSGVCRAPDEEKRGELTPDKGTKP